MKLAQELKKLCESFNEADAEIEQTREKVAEIEDKIKALKLKIHKETQLGKSDTLLGNLKKDWNNLQDQVVKTWKQYDQKHGTKYASNY